MRELVALTVLLVLLFGCEFKVNYSVDGEPHSIVLNPEVKP